MRSSGFCILALPMLVIGCQLGAPSEPDPWLTLPAGNGPGAGKHVVLISGDEEYRSEEALPMLARILSVHHGFRTTVLFAIDPETALIDPNNQSNIPGLDALDSADLMVLFTRFRELPDAQMAHIVDYLDSGKPIIGIRTATHAFRYQRNPDSPYAKYDFQSRDWPGGFGRQVLGETWVNHHGKHGEQSTRGVVNPDHADHPVLRGVGDIWGPTDVYGVTELPEGSRVLVWGQVVEGMSPDDPPLQGAKNDPMMPLAWVRHYRGETGNTSRIFCTTAGASVDLLSEGLRRLLVNAVYWGLGMEEEIPDSSNVEIVGDYQPTFFGFHPESEYWREKALRPSDWRLP